MDTTPHLPAELVLALRRGIFAEFVSMLENLDLDRLERILSPDCADENPLPFQPPGPRGVALKIACWKALAPQARTSVEQVQDTPDGLCARWITRVGDQVSRWEGRFSFQDQRICAFGARRVD